MMNIQTLKKWKENGFLEAALDGKLQVKFSYWQDITNEGFDLDINREYRIKPKFEVCDLVKYYGGICVVVAVYDNTLNIIPLKGGMELNVFQNKLTKVKQILKPHTFETAVKDCAENGFEIREGFKITALKPSFFYINGGYREYSDPYLYFPNDKPFCQVEYEECT